MAQSLTRTIALASLAFVSARASCVSFGIDFQNGGSYFQNSHSHDPFTALQNFEGCQNDTAYNVLVDPSGNQQQCSNTAMQPDGKAQLITCQDDPKDILYTGNWSLIVISNNGGEDSDPIAYQRDFFLDVAPQKTEYIWPTVTAFGPYTVVSPTTSMTTVIFTSTVPVTTITATPKIPARFMPKPPEGSGWTQQAEPSYIKKTTTLTTIYQTHTEFEASATTQMVPAECTAPTAPAYNDKPCEILPTVLGEMNDVARKVVEGVEDAFKGLSQHEREGSSAYKRAIMAGKVPTEEERTAFVAERAAHLNRFEKRAPDSRTTTITLIDLKTVFMPAPHVQTLMMPVFNTDTIFSTISAGTATVTGAHKVPITVRAAVPTETQMVTVPYVISSTTVTSTTIITQTMTTTGADAAQTCAEQGMFLH